jgi:hypothetical protein
MSPRLRKLLERVILVVTSDSRITTMEASIIYQRALAGVALECMDGDNVKAADLIESDIIPHLRALAADMRLKGGRSEPFAAGGRRLDS